MSCRECNAECGQGENICPPCFVAEIEARDADAPKPGQFGYQPQNPVERAMDQAARLGKNYGNGTVR